MTFTPAAAEGTPEGYTANPTQKNILLEEGQYYKELTGFEGTGIRQADIDRKSDGELLYSTLSPNNGSKLAKVVHTKGSSGENRNIIKIFCMQFDNPDVGKDWSQAAYLQMYVLQSECHAGAAEQHGLSFGFCGWNQSFYEIGSESQILRFKG